MRVCTSAAPEWSYAASYINLPLCKPDAVYARPAPKGSFLAKWALAVTRRRGDTK